MKIPRIDYLIFGYRKVTLDEKDFKNAVNAFISKKLSLRLTGLSFLVSEKEFKRMKEGVLSPFSYTVTEPLGLFGALQRYKTRFGAIIAVFFSLFLCFYSRSRVWDIRISGAEAGTEEKISEELRALGLSEGASFRKIDKAKIESELLATSDLVSWININQRGVVAYVEVIGKASHEEEVKRDFANIVASRDGIVEEITVKRGFALVKAGETVKKGQILISGVVPSALGGGFCYAEGEVIARYTDEISLEIPQKETESCAVAQKLHKKNIKIFNFSFKFLKRYGKIDKEYDIIKEKRKFLNLFGKNLPISYQSEYLVFREDVEIAYTKDEMIRLANRRMRDEIARRLSDKNLLKIKTSGAFSEDRYLFKSEYVVSADIAKTEEFFFLEKQVGD